ncbi:hypothetical protein FB384_004795 [Prauserella sediminis]|uniref:Glycosyltransferase RgtA/B/C/D-like domain-containing protein n=1 Tax=Prauserella sediminis TaxID=577680 RepID=A0A839Y0M3_9PSEU|nr:hypothetical protein [Prauserella sediminis]MBB3665836.1 hypothetical protein [Prauserella sediminis]
MVATRTAAETAHPQEKSASGAARLPRWRSRLQGAAAVAAGSAMIGAHGAYYGNWIVDDAAITFSYARSFSEGLGPVVQAGAQPVEGFSNVTWTLLLALARLVGLFDHGTIFGIPDYVLLPKVLALVLCAGILTACHAALTRVLVRPWLGTLAVGGLLAMTPSFVIWVVSGLENALYGLLITTLAVLVFRAVLDDAVLRWRLAVGAGLLAALAALTRPEGLIYGGVYPLVVLGTLWRSRGAPVSTAVRYIALSTAAFVGAAGAYFLWRRVTFGEWLSAPSIAKSQGLPYPTDLPKAGQIVGYAGAPAILLVCVFVGMLLARPPWWRRGLFALLVPLGLGLVAFTVLEDDWMGHLRFATPIWVLGALTAVLAAAEVVRRVRGGARAAVVTGMVVALVASGSSFAVAAYDFRRAPTLSACHVADRYGRAFNGYADLLGLDRASLLLPDLGGTSMTSRLRLVDMAGLTDVRMAHMIRNEDRAGTKRYVFDEVRPTFIHTRLPWTGGGDLTEDPRFTRDYVRIFAEPGHPWPDGDWVRRDVVPDSATLERLRAYAGATAGRVADASVAPTSSCGDTLGVGSTLRPAPPGGPAGRPGE